MTVVRRFLLATALIGALPASLAPAVASAAPAAPSFAVCSPPAATAATVADIAPIGFVPIDPVRLADTRIGLGAAAAPIEAGCVISIGTAVADPPNNATAAALTVTSDGSSRTGFVTAYPCGSARPSTSILNPAPDGPRSNLAVVPLDDTGQLCFFSEQRTNLIVDVTGWFTPDGARAEATTPARIYDSRSSTPTGTVGPRETVRLPAATVLPDGGVAAAVTVTLTNAAGSTYATAFPCGTSVPPTSTVNTLRGVDRAAPALVGVGDEGLCVYVDQPAGLIVDVTSRFTSATAVGGSPMFQAASVRLADSRTGLGWAAGRLPAGSTRPLDVLNSAAVGATTVQLNVTAADATADGYLTVYPCGGAVPATSSVNFRAGETAAAMVTVDLGPTGEVCVLASAPAHVIVDLFSAYGHRGLLRTIRSRFGNPPIGDGQTDFALGCTNPAQSAPLVVTTPPGITIAATTLNGSPITTLPQLQHPGDAFTFTLAGRSTDTISLRCLPADFPTFDATGVATPGWFVGSTLAGPASFVFILDRFGVPVWWKSTPTPVVGVWPEANGTLAWRTWTGGGFPGGNGSPESPALGFQIHDLTGATVGSVGPVGGTESLDWHELLDLPGGGHLVVTYPQRTIGSNRPCVKATDGTQTTTNKVVDSDLVELNAAGTEVWRWSSKDHTDLTTETKIPICFQVGSGPTFALDYMHLNSVERLADGDYVVGARHFNAIERIDHTTGAVEWKLGGSAPTTGTLLAVKDANGQPAGPGAIPIGPHDARVLANGDVTVHDNHVGGAPRASEYRIDTAAGTATLVWQRISTNPTGSTLGSVRRLDDGSTVIAWGEGHTPWLEEVSPSGSDSLRIDVPTGTTFYRGVKVPASTFDLATLRARAGGSSS